MKALTILFTLLILSSCSILKKKGTWGKDAFYPIKGEAIRNALIKNMTSPHVYAPVLGAGVVHVMAWDNKVSHFINKDRVLFNEQHEADNYSDNFNIIQKYEMYLSIFAPPSHDSEESTGNYLLNKIKGGLLVNMASSASKIAHHSIRSTTDRKRPNGRDHNSMPSGHATEAGSRRVLIARNIQASGLSTPWQYGIDGANTFMSFAVMWARVEGKRHYPSDVLMGYALGNFVSGFLYDSFINFDEQSSVSVTPLRSGASLNLTFSF